MSKTENKFDIPEKVKNVSERLSAAKFENYLVGGCVRDILLNRKPKDWDITTIATPEEITPLFEHTFYENDYGTVGVVDDNPDDESLRVVEVTPYRTESGYSDFRRPDEIKWAKTLEEDLKRRDFTINALAYDLKEDTLIDLVDGRSDIKNKLIRTVGNPEERFSEDALRILRALRFASELGFAIESETLSAIDKHKALLSNISKERIRDEFIKIIMSPSPSIALGIATQLKMLSFISPEFEKGVGMEQNKAHIYTVWEHLIRSLDHSAKKDFPLHVRLATLLHDIAKPHTRKMINGQWTFYGHDVVGSKIAKNILTDLKFPRDIVEKVVKLVRWHMFFSETETITLSAVRRIVRNVGPDLIWDLMNVRACDRTGMGRPKETTYRLRKYHSMIEEVMRDPISVKQLNVNGKDIMDLSSKGPGPHIGYILEILLSEVLENPVKNDRKNLEERVVELSKLEPKELSKLGGEARRKNESEDERELAEIKDKYKVE
ncbi:MAG: CCA tRNA nucleotidyltransferase [Minisyncoccota bacterium]